MCSFVRPSTPLSLSSSLLLLFLRFMLIYYLPFFIYFFFVKCDVLHNLRSFYSWLKKRESESKIVRVRVIKTWLWIFNRSFLVRPEEILIKYQFIIHHLVYRTKWRKTDRKVDQLWPFNHRKQVLSKVIVAPSYTPTHTTYITQHTQHIVYII